MRLLADGLLYRDSERRRRTPDPRLYRTPSRRPYTIFALRDCKFIIIPPPHFQCSTLKHIHLPLHYILISIINSFLAEQYHVRFFYCIISILVPFLFYLNLKIKFPEINKNLLLVFASTLFILPTFRYTAIWANVQITAKNLAKSINLGIQKSKYENIIWMDADFQHPPDNIKLFHNYQEKFDLIIFSRFLKDSTRYFDDNISKKKINEPGSIFFNKLCRSLLYKDITDYTSGFICIKKKFLKTTC